ncbi:MAG: hypothetical protein HY716_04755 [Planctomycetes bacterium]|nr:hypothetical protein [Planctomycetota bacterium]
MKTFKLATALSVLLALASCGKSEPPAAPATKPQAAPDAPGQPKKPEPPGAEIRGETTFAFKPAPPGAKPERGDTAVLALLGDIDSFNPFVSSSADAAEIHDLIFPRLMTEQPNYYLHPPSFEPQIAESWTFGDDGRSIRFKLRECSWSDGRAITSEDVRFSWQAAKHPDVAWVSASIVDFITDIEIHDPREFTVRYAESYPYQLMDINDVQVLPKHAFGQVPFEKWQTHGRWEEQAKVCGGPWQLQSYTPNQEVTLVRNPKYWEDGKPYLEKAIFRVLGDMRTQINTLLAKDLDAMRGVTPQEARRVLNAGHLNLFTYVSRAYGYAGWNCKEWPFDDARVRRAMTLAIDRENIVESIFYGYAQVAGPAIISSMWASHKKIRPLPYDPEQARKLLEEAGWTKGADDIYEKDGKPLRFTMITNAGNDVRRQMCEYIQSDLKKIGVAMDIRLIDFNQMSTQLKKHQFQAYVGGWFVATKVDNKPIWHSTAAEGRFNYVNYADPRVDEIIDTARVMSDFQKAKPLWDEFQEILDRDQPYTMLYEPRGLVAVDARFVNVNVTSLRYTDNLHEWWVPKEKQRYK